jgi:hypothetical protein
VSAWPLESCAMPSRRSKPRVRKARTTGTPPNDVAVPASLAAADPVAELARAVDPTETAQLRALEAGWDELLS